MFKAGCAQNAAGQTLESVDISFLAVLAMMVSYGLFFIVFMIWPNFFSRVTVLRTALFFIVWIPATAIIAISIEGRASEECAPRRWRSPGYTEGEFRHKDDLISNWSPTIAMDTHGYAADHLKH